MNTEHITAVFKEYILLPDENYAMLLNGTWGSGKTFFWQHELQPIAEAAGRKTLYISLNGINNRGTLEQLMFIRMLPFLNQGNSKWKTQAAHVIGNLANLVAKKKLDANLQDIFRGLSLDTIMYEEYVICFDDLERCGMPLPEILGFINNFVEHRKLKTLILSDEEKVNKNMPDYAGIKEKVIGRTLNFHVDHDLVLPKLYEKYITDTKLLSFLKEQESYIRNLLLLFKENNLRIVAFCLSVIARLYPILRNRNEGSVQDALFCVFTIGIDYKRGYLKSGDEGNYKELNMLAVVQQFWSQPGNDKENTNPAIIKTAYPKEFFDRYLKDSDQQFYLSEPIYNYILSGYLDERLLEAEFEKRDPNNIPEYLVCFPLLINYKFRDLSDSSFAYFIEKTRQYAEEGLYSIYNYLQIVDFYFYFSDNGLITLSYEDILDFARKGLAKAAGLKETNADIYGNMMHFTMGNPASEAFKEEVSAAHLKIIREKKQAVIAKIISHIIEDNTGELTKAFQDFRFDQDFLPAADMDAFCNALLTASNRTISKLANIFDDRYNATNIKVVLPNDIASLKIFDRYIDGLITDPAIGQLRRFVLKGLSNAVKTGISRMEST